MTKLGLITGGGAGPELAAVFRRAVATLLPAVELLECTHVPRSFTEMKDWPVEDFEASVADDLRALRAYYLECAATLAPPVIFRTAVNAEALYVLRRELLAVKAVPVEIGASRLLLIRDETQGFYANEDWTITGSRVDAHATYRLDRLRTVVAAAQREARSWLRGDCATWLIYKHHLFANIFCRWAEEIGGIDEVLQPGAAYMKLLQHLETAGSDLLVVASNETADFLHEVILARDGTGARDISIARNLYLHPDLNGLIEYQTVHGSADDIARSGRVNPLATLRAAAAIAQREFGRTGAVGRMESAIQQARKSGHLTDTLEVRTTTDGIVDAILAGYRQPVAAGTSA